jgi:hypothetical protein
MQTHDRGMWCNLFFKNLWNTYTFTLYILWPIAAETFTVSTYGSITDYFHLQLVSMLMRWAGTALPV